MTTIMLKATIYVDIDKDVGMDEALNLDENELLFHTLAKVEGALDVIMDWKDVKIVGLLAQDE